MDTELKSAADYQPSYGTAPESNPPFEEDFEAANKQKMLRKVLLGLFLIAVLSLTMAVIYTVVLNRFLLSLWPAMFACGVTLLTVMIAAALIAFVFACTTPSKPIMVFLALFMLSGAFLAIAITGLAIDRGQNSDFRDMETRWDTFVNERPSVLCTLQERQHCSGWNTLCNTGSNASHASPAPTPANCPSCPGLSINFSTTCHVWLRRRMLSFLPIAAAGSVFCALALGAGFGLIMAAYFTAEPERSPQ